jgi:putrescine transport system permease protein
MESGRTAWRGWGTRVILWMPYLWLVVFILVPALIVLKISLSDSTDAQPPYVPVLDLAAGWAGIRSFIAGLEIDSYTKLVSDDIYVLSYLTSLEVAAVSTAILLVIGYPLAYAMARAPRRLQPVLVMLVVLPFWTSFLIRVYAWIDILQENGLLNRVLLAVGLLDRAVVWRPSDTAVYIGLVYCYLPFMVLPLYAVLEKIDETLLEAAADLGAARWKAFWLVTVPLSLPGIGAGTLLCFIPIVGEYVIPDLMGGSGNLMIARTLWNAFDHDRDWPLASAIAVVLLLLLIVPMAVYQNLQLKSVERGD